MSEIVCCVASDIDVSDSTEQLALTMMAKQVINNDTDADYMQILQHAVVKIIISFVTHHLTLLIISLCHSPTMVGLQDTYQQIHHLIS